MAVCVVIQCVVVATLFRVLLSLELKRMLRPSFVENTALIAGFTLIMMVGSLVQISVWAGLFLLRAEFADFATAFYHSTVNFSTLGYGDIVMSEQGRLLGALEAANGVLMFGLTTGVLYSVFNALLRRGWEARVAEGKE